MIEPILFPHENHPYRIQYGEKKDITVCWFSCEEHLDKYLERYKLDKKNVKVDYRDAKPIKSGKTNKTNIQQGTRKSSNRSSGGTRRSTKNLDASGNVNRTRESKK